MIQILLEVVMDCTIHFDLSSSLTYVFDACASASDLVESFVFGQGRI